MYILTSGVTINYNGDNLRITINLESGITQSTINIEDIYYYWKLWVINSGSTYLKAFDLLGGNPIDNNKIISYYHVLSNNWKIIIKTDSIDYVELVINGNLITDDNSFIFKLDEFVGKIYVRTLISANILTTSFTDELEQINQNILEHRFETENRIKNILGLSQQNFRIKDQIYDNNLLISSTIRIYNNKHDTEDDINFINEYKMNAEYDINGKLTKYVVKEN